MNLLQIPVYLKTMYKANKSAKLVFSTINSKFNIDSSSSSGKTLPDFSGSVIFNNVYFSYLSQPQNEVLQGVSFNILPGQTVAIAGASGSGKTTCLNLISRFYDPHYGSILLDDNNLQHLNLPWLRSKIGFVTDECTLIGATVGDAIRCGLNSISQNEVVEIAKTVDVHDDVMMLPKKYSSPISTSLSDDIRKKLAIARVLIRKPFVLMLDSFSSNLSAEDEDKLLKAIIKMSNACASTGIAAHDVRPVLGEKAILSIKPLVFYISPITHGTHKSLIVVSSRLETLKMVDKIIHIVNGVVVEEDSYAKLIENEQWFFNVIKRKFKLGSKQINSEDSIEECKI